MSHYRSALLPVILLFSLSVVVTSCDSAGTDGMEQEPPPADRIFVTEWMTTINQSVQAGKLAPNPIARLHGYAGVAFYEGVRRAYPDRYQTLAGQVKGLRSLPTPEQDGSYDWSTVAAVTEGRVVKGLLRDEEVSEATLGRVDSLRDQQVQRRQSVGVSSAVLDRSKTYGQRLGSAILTWARQDGAQDIRGLPYKPPEGPQYWEPTPPRFAPALLPYWQRVRPFGINPGTHQPPAPPEYSEDTTSTFFKQMKKVHEVSQKLSDQDVATAEYWKGVPGLSATLPGQWVSIARRAAEKKDLGLGETARVWALLGMASHDAFISVWKSKYGFEYVRPITAVRRLVDEDWTIPIATPPFPEYSPGHSVGAGAMSKILNHAFGGAVSFTDRTQTDRGYEARSFDSFQAAAEQCGYSRVLGGVHYPVSNERGLEQGRNVAEAVAEKVELRRE